MRFAVRKGSEKGSQKGSLGVSRRCLERPLGEYDPLGVRLVHSWLSESPSEKERMGIQGLILQSPQAGHNKASRSVKFQKSAILTRYGENAQRA